MSLSHSFESSGKWLFKYRGQLPVLLFFASVPFIYFTDYKSFSNGMICFINCTGVGFAILGFIIRFYTIATSPAGTSGRNRNEQVAVAVNSTGIYSMVRHPLYLGNFFIWLGIVITTLNFYFVIIFCLIYWIYYERIMYAEEKFLEKQFGQQFIDWSSKVPAFLPRFNNYIKSSTPFSGKIILRREYAGLLATVGGFSFVNLVSNYLHKDQLSLHNTWLYALPTAAVLAIILRILRKNTGLLK